jgi:hypothetical protein
VAERVRIEVGFDSGQVMGAAVAPETADALEQALGSGQEGAFQLDVEDGRYSLVLRRIVYLKRFAREARVGFGA